MRSAGLLALIALSAFLAACASLPTGNEPGSEPAPGVVPVAPVTTAGQATYDLYLWVASSRSSSSCWSRACCSSSRCASAASRTDDDAAHADARQQPARGPVDDHPGDRRHHPVRAPRSSTLNKLDATAANPAVTVDVTGFQWQWTFAYQDQGHQASPARARTARRWSCRSTRPCASGCTPKDVIHSFYVPQFFYKLDVIPGRTNEFEVSSTRPARTAASAPSSAASATPTCTSPSGRDRAPSSTPGSPQQQQAASATAGAAPPARRPAASRLTAVSITAGFDPTTLTAPARPADRPPASPTPTRPRRTTSSIQKANPDGTDWLGRPIAEPAARRATYSPPPLAAGDVPVLLRVHPQHGRHAHSAAVMPGVAGLMATTTLAPRAAAYPAASPGSTSG